MQCIRKPRVKIAANNSTTLMNRRSIAQHYEIRVITSTIRIITSRHLNVATFAAFAYEFGNTQTCQFTQRC